MNMYNNLSIIAVENVQRTVVFCSFHILNVILHFQLDTIPVIVFPAFKLLVSKFLSKTLETKCY